MSERVCMGASAFGCAREGEPVDESSLGVVLGVGVTADEFKWAVISVLATSLYHLPTTDH